MGCIPSKHVVLPDGNVVTQREFKRMNKKVKKTRGGGPASPVVDGEAPPWVTGHRVVELDEKNRIIGQRWSVLHQV
jgi:hypothetical protein